MSDKMSSLDNFDTSEPKASNKLNYSNAPNLVGLSLPDADGAVVPDLPLEVRKMQKKTLQLYCLNIYKFCLQVWECVLHYVDSKQLLPLRRVNKEWKTEIDKVLAKRVYLFWKYFHTTTNHKDPPSITKFLPYGAAISKFSCELSMHMYEKNCYLGRIRDKFRFTLPGHSLWIKNQEQAKTNIHKLFNSNNVTHSHRDWGMHKVASDKVFYFYLHKLLYNVGDTVRIVVFDNLKLNEKSISSDGFQVFEFFKKILPLLPNVEVLVLFNAWSLDDQNYKFNPKSITDDKELTFCNLKKLVISNGHIGIIEYCLLQMAPFIEELCIIEPFLPSLKTNDIGLLEPLERTAGLFKKLKTLTLEMSFVVRFPYQTKNAETIELNWEKLTKIIAITFLNIKTLVVVLNDEMLRYVPKVFKLASKLPKLLELKIYGAVFGANFIGSYPEYAKDMFEIEKNGLNNLKSLYVGENMIKKWNIGIIHWLFTCMHLLVNLEKLVFDDIGYNNLTFVCSRYGQKRLKQDCNNYQRDFFECIPSLKLVEATRVYLNKFFKITYTRL